MTSARQDHLALHSDAEARNSSRASDRSFLAPHDTKSSYLCNRRSSQPGKDCSKMRQGGSTSVSCRQLSHRSRPEDVLTETPGTFVFSRQVGQQHRMTTYLSAPRQLTASAICIMVASFDFRRADATTEYNGRAWKQANGTTPYREMALWRPIGSCVPVTCSLSAAVGAGSYIPRGWRCLWHAEDG